MGVNRRRVLSCLVAWISVAGGIEERIESGEQVVLSDTDLMEAQQTTASMDMKLTPGEAVKQTEAELMVHTGDPKAGPNMQMLGYNEIFNLAYLHGGRKVEVKSRVECENVCDQHADCHSFSYRAGDKRCVWTKKPLDWDTRWSLFIKEKKMNHKGEDVHTGKWKRFDSIGYLDQSSADTKSGLFTVRTMDVAACKEMCKNLKQCHAVSYREYDEACVMGDDGITFNSDWTFFPKNKHAKPKARRLGDAAPSMMEARVDEQDGDNMKPTRSTTQWITSHKASKGKDAPKNKSQQSATPAEVLGPSEAKKVAADVEANAKAKTTAGEVKADAANVLPENAARATAMRKVDEKAKHMRSENEIANKKKTAVDEMKRAQKTAKEVTKHISKAVTKRKTTSAKIEEEMKKHAIAVESIEKQLVAARDQRETAESEATKAIQVAKTKLTAASTANAAVDKPAISQIMQAVEAAGQKGFLEGKKILEAELKKARAAATKKQDAHQAKASKAAQTVINKAETDTSKVVKKWEAHAEKKAGKENSKAKDPTMAKAADAKAKGTDARAGDNSVKSKDADENAKGGEGNAKGAEGKTTDSEGKTTDSEGKTTDSEGKTTDTEGKTEDTEGKAKDTKGKAKNAEGKAKDTDTKASDSDVKAKGKSSKESAEAVKQKPTKVVTHTHPLKEEIEKESGRVDLLAKAVTNAKGDTDKESLLRRLRIAKAKERLALSQKLIAQHRAKVAALKTNAKGAIEAEQLVASLKVKDQNPKEPSLVQKKVALEAVDVHNRKAFAQALAKWNKLKHLVSPHDQSSPEYKDAQEFLAEEQQAAKQSVQRTRKNLQESSQKLATIWKRLAMKRGEKAAEIAVIHKTQRKKEMKQERLQVQQNSQKAPHIKMQEIYNQAFAQATHKHLQSELEAKMEGPPNSV